MGGSNRVLPDIFNQRERAFQVTKKKWNFDWIQRWLVVIFYFGWNRSSFTGSANQFAYTTSCFSSCIQCKGI